MAKRFTDTLKYKKQFLRSLKAPYKLLWDYLYHDCDHAGIWIVDFQIAQTYLGQDAKVNHAEALKSFNLDEKRIVEIDKGKKWFIPSFISFQYGQLSEKNRAHINVISVLRKYDLVNDDLTLKNIGQGPSMPLTSPLQGAKEQEKEQEQEMEKVKEQERRKNFISEWFVFYEKRVGVKPKFDSTQANALQSIQDHLAKVSTTDPVDAWKYILTNWHKQDEWMQGQLDLKIINSKFNNVLNNLKNGTGKKPTGGQTSLQSIADKIAAMPD